MWYELDLGHGVRLSTAPPELRNWRPPGSGSAPGPAADALEGGEEAGEGAGRKGRKQRRADNTAPTSLRPSLFYLPGELRVEVDIISAFV